MKNDETLLLRKEKQHFQQGDFLSVDFYQPTFCVIVPHYCVFHESIRAGPIFCLETKKAALQLKMNTKHVASFAI